jgi:4-hydroxy-tetrahydrodipicolinate synthase
MEKALKRGFVPVMLTPFDQSGEIDYDTLTRLTAFYLEAGATGLFANCLSSEMYELSGRERLRIIARIVDDVKGAVPVVATGSFGSSVAEQADFVKRVYDQGVDAVILITGLLANARESAAVFEERVEELLELTPGIPLGFYECPVPYKRILSPGQLGRFVKTGRVIYHKDTSLDIKSIRAKLKAAEGHTFGLYDAYMGHAVKSLKAGAAGLSCIQGNFFPELVVWLCDNYANAERQAEVAEVQQFFDDHMDVMHEVYPVVAKYFLQMRGFELSAFTRRQVGMYSADAMEGITALHRRYTILKERIGLHTLA